MPKAPDKSGHSFRAYFKRATSPLVVLRLLLEKPMYGYELTQEMKRRSGGSFTISVLYPVLYRLEKQGFIETSDSLTVDGRARSYYQITLAGRDYLSETLADYHMISSVFEKLVEGSEAFDL
jgi:PadR family transcriptional regulator PadR